jgi:hypothetical protein
MNAHKSHHPKRTLKPIVFALALAMPGAAVVAASMGDVVKTRADQTIDQQYGRDSVYGFSPESKPLSPERTFGPQAQNSDNGTPTALQASPAPAAEPAVENIGSGYTDSDAIADVGSGYVGVEDEDATLVPLTRAGEDETALESDRGYYQDPDQIVVVLPYDDDTAHQYDRGYYQDPDQVAVVIIEPDLTALQPDESASVARSNVAVAE